MSAPIAPSPTDHEISTPRRLEGPVRVNLLPETTRQRDRAARQRALAIAFFLGLLLVLGLLYWSQLSRVNDRQAQLAAEQNVVNELQTELAQLSEFEQLQARLERADAIVTAALSDEVSFAGALQDMAAVTPSSTWLESLSITIQDEVTVPLGAEGATIGRLTATGVEANSHAPGLERLLLELDKVASFGNVFFSDSTIVGDDREFVDGDGDETTFSLEMDLGLQARTGRYDDGVPEVLR
jgi:Tfp pilus assembly protein PilN